MKDNLEQDRAFPNNFNHFLPLFLVVGLSLLAFRFASQYLPMSGWDPDYLVFNVLSIGIFLPVLTLWLGLLFAPWAGWVPLLFVGVVLHLALLLNPWIIGPLTMVYTIPALILAAQRGYLSYWRSDWRRLMAAYAFFDDRLAQRHPWIAGLNPFYYVFSRHQHWRSHRVQYSYDQLRVFNRYSPKIRRMASIHLKVYWPLWLMNPVWLGAMMLFLLVEGFLPVSKVVIDPIEHLISIIPYDPIFVPIAWFLFFPWVGWLPLCLVLGDQLLNHDYQSLTVPALFCILLLLQKGYFKFNRDWPRMMVSTVFIDTRLHRHNKLITRLNPAIIGMEYLPPLAKKLGIPPRVTLFAWWTFLLLVTWFFLPIYDFFLPLPGS